MAKKSLQDVLSEIEGTQPPQEDIGAFLNSIYGQTGAKAQMETSALPQMTRTTLPGQVGQAESFVKGYAQGGTLGFAEEIGAGMQAGLEQARQAIETSPMGRQALEALGIGVTPTQTMAAGKVYVPEKETTQQTYEAARAANRMEEERAQRSNPLTYFGGQVGGGVALTAATGQPIGLRGAVGMGAIQGLGSSEADLLRGELGQAAQDVATGGAFGAGGYGFAKGIGAAAPVVGKKLGEGAKALGLDRLAQDAKDKALQAVKDFAALRAVKATGAIGTELKRYSPEQLKRIGGTLLKEEVIPWSGNKEVIGEATEAMRQKAGNFMDELYKATDTFGEQTGKGFNWQPIITKVKALQKNLDPTARRATENIFAVIDDLKASKAAGKGFQDAVFQKNTIAEITKAYEPRDTLSRGLGKDIERIIANEVESQMENIWSRAKDPEVVNAVMKGIKTAKRNYEASYLAEAGLERAKMQQGNNPFGLSAVVVGGPTTAAQLAGGNLPGAVSSGLGLAGATELLRRRGSAVMARGAQALPGAVGRATQAMQSTGQKLLQTLQSRPEAFGRFAQPLMKAAQTNPQDFAVTDYTLANQSPEYRSLRDALMEEEQAQ